MAEIRINTTGGLKLYDADNSHYAQIVAGTITSNVDAITLGHNLATFNAAVTATGILKTDDTTEATSTTDGSLQTDGGLSVAKDAIIGDDLKLLSDSAVLSLGAGSDITFTHDGTTGLTIAATPISIDATGELHLNSTTGDIKLQDGGTDQIAFDLDGTAGEVIMKPAVDSDDLVISQYDGTEVIRIEDNASLGLVGNKLNIANSSSDVIVKPLTDAKDVIFQQYDGNEVMRINDSRKLQFYDDGGESITADGSKLIIESGGTTFNLPTSDGSSGQAITTNGSGVLSFADAGGGKVLQAVTTYSTSKSTSTTHDSPVYWLNASLTPASSNSKVLVLGYLTMVLNDDNNRCGGILKRDSTVLKNSGSDHDDFFNGSFNHVNDSNASAVSLPFVYLDSPSTTSSTTYYLGSQANANQMHFNRSTSNNVGYTSSITLLEIGA